jgi:DNA gyrase subunit A
MRDFMIHSKSIEDEIRVSYLEYAMSVIVSRAIPDARDGLKPVQRKIIYAMGELGFTHDKPYKKSARIVGETMGKYHPHGDMAIYDALARMAQPFSLRYPLIDGQGNFGSIDGDSPAAMRYTEARLLSIAEDMIQDLDRETVPFKLNFDGSLQEPEYFPSKIPQLLINGSSGIAVGMATSLVPHNLTEICESVKATVSDPGITLARIMEIVKGPDFPGGGLVYRDEGMLNAYLTGRGKVKVRGEVDLTEEKRIIITSIPYEMNKARYIENLAEKVKNDQIRGIVDIRDESDRDGIRVVLKLKDESSKNLILNQLYELTELEKTVSIINLVLVDNQPKTVNIKQLIEIFIEHRLNIILKRSEFDLRKSREREHILQGLFTAVSNLDRVIEIIRSSREPKDARSLLMTELSLSEVQADAILDMRLQRLTGQEVTKIKEDLDNIRKKIDDLLKIVSDEGERRKILVTEMNDLITKYGDDRRSRVIEGEITRRSMEELIPKEDCVIILTEKGIVKRVPLEDYRSQRRGGKGIITSTWKEDVIRSAVSGNSHDDILYFTDLGRVFAGKVYEIEKRARTSNGISVQSLLKLQDKETVKQIMIPSFTEGSSIFIATKAGYIKRIDSNQLQNIRSTGIRIITLEEGDTVVAIEVLQKGDRIAVVSEDAKIAIFEPVHVRSMGRQARGVRSMRLPRGRSVLTAFAVSDTDYILSVSENGIGKRTKASEFPVHNRGTSGVFIFRENKRTGKLVSAIRVKEEDEILVLTKGEKSIRTAVKDIREISRVTSGVKLVDLEGHDLVVSVTRI